MAFYFPKSCSWLLIRTEYGLSLDNDASNLPVKCFLPLYSGGAVAGAGVVSLEKKTLGDLITVYKYLMNKQYGKETGLVLWVPKGGSGRNGSSWYRKDFQTKREGTLVLFKMERAMGMWNVLVQKKWDSFK